MLLRLPKTAVNLTNGYMTIIFFDESCKYQPVELAKTEGLPCLLSDLLAWDEKTMAGLEHVVATNILQE